MKYGDLRRCLAMGGQYRSSKAKIPLLYELENAATYHVLAEQDNPSRSDEDDIPEECCAKLKEILKLRWERIRHTLLGYTEDYHNPINLCCYQLATHIEQSQRGLSRFQLLMPSIEVTESAVTGMRLDEPDLTPAHFILNDDQTVFVHVGDCLAFAENDGVLKHTFVLHQGQTKILSESEKTRLLSHSREAQKYYADIAKRHEYTHEECTIGGLLTKLIEGLRAGDSIHGGTEYEAGSDANVAIDCFFEKYDFLPDSVRKNVERKGCIDTFHGGTRVALKELFSRLRNPASVKNESDQLTIYCVHLISDSLQTILEANRAEFFRERFTLGSSAIEIADRRLKRAKEAFDTAQRNAQFSFVKKKYTDHDLMALAIGLRNVLEPRRDGLLFKNYPISLEHYMQIFPFDELSKLYSLGEIRDYVCRSIGGKKDYLIRILNLLPPPSRFLFLVNTGSIECFIKHIHSLEDLIASICLLDERGAWILVQQIERNPTFIKTFEAYQSVAKVLAESSRVGLFRLFYEHIPGLIQKLSHLITMLTLIPQEEKQNLLQLILSKRPDFIPNGDALREVLSSLQDSDRLTFLRRAQAFLSEFIRQGNKAEVVIDLLPEKDRYNFLLLLGDTWVPDRNYFDSVFFQLRKQDRFPFLQHIRQHLSVLVDGQSDIPLMLQSLKKRSRYEFLLLLNEVFLLPYFSNLRLSYNQLIGILRLFPLNVRYPFLEKIESILPQIARTLRPLFEILDNLPDEDRRTFLVEKAALVRRCVMSSECVLSYFSILAEREKASFLLQATDEELTRWIRKSTHLAQILSHLSDFSWRIQLLVRMKERIPAFIENYGQLMEILTLTPPQACFGIVESVKNIFPRIIENHEQVVEILSKCQEVDRIRIMDILKDRISELLPSGQAAGFYSIFNKLLFNDQTRFCEMIGENLCRIMSCEDAHQDPRVRRAWRFENQKETWMEVWRKSEQAVLKSDPSLLPLPLLIKTIRNIFEMISSSWNRFRAGFWNTKGGQCASTILERLTHSESWSGEESHTNLERLISFLNEQLAAIDQRYRSVGTKARIPTPSGETAMRIMLTRHQVQAHLACALAAESPGERYRMDQRP